MKGHGSGRNSWNDRDRYDVCIDLHGMYAEEAMALVEQTVRTHPRSGILVVHGNGTGVLRSKVRGALKSHRFPQVRDYFFGEDIGAPGLDGATVIYT